MDGIEVIDVHKEYVVDNKKLQVLKGVSLNIPKNKITVILGQSGCGKTTLLRIIGGLENHNSGEITNGSEKTAFVFQEPRLMPWLDVKNNITFGINKKEVDINNFHKILNTVGLKGFEKAYPNQLSGGMQQRVALGRALMFNPSFILMDEPFAALDFFTRGQMQKELLRVHQQNDCGILFVTHSIDEAMLLGHNIIILEQGVVKQSYEINTNNNERYLLDPKFIEIKKDIIKKLNIL